MSKARIFISYRRDDAAGDARAVYDELARQFGPERVFIDVDDSGAGHMFDIVIRQAVSASTWLAAALLALAIGLAGVWQGHSPASSEGAASPGRLASSACATASAMLRAGVNGEWQAEVVHDWPNARHTERFVFSGEAGALQGSARFLRVPRGLPEGADDAAGLQFSTRTEEISGGASMPTVHRYLGTWLGNEIRFVMQTEGGTSTHVPVEFIARRVTAAGSSAAR